jgi:predicted RNA-binding protein with PUA-like domain
MPLTHWLVKSEPGTYGWDDLVAEKRTLWTGVRNHTAKGHLAAMKKGDLVLFYHSGEGKEVVGVAKVTAEAVPDPTAPADEGWVAAQLAPVNKLAAPVSLAAIKAEASLREIPLVRLSRLSVMPIPPKAYEKILAMAKTKLGG